MRAAGTLRPLIRHADDDVAANGKQFSSEGARIVEVLENLEAEHEVEVVQRTVLKEVQVDLLDAAS